MLGIRFGVAALLLLASGSTALATCQGRVVLFEDRFERLQPTWGEADDVFKTEDGKLVLAPEPAAYLWRTNQASLYDDVDMCVAITTIDEAEPDESKAGLVFWYVDENNFYVFEYAPNGKASVWRRQRGRWLEQVEWQEVEEVDEVEEGEDAEEGEEGENGQDGEEVEAAETGEEATVELRVVTRGDRATLFFNESEFAEFDGVQPAEGQQVGVFAASPESGVARFSFDNFKVTRP